QAIAREQDSANWLKSIGKAYLEARASARIVLVDLWIQALTEAADDPEIRRALGRQVREVHEFVADVIRRAQEAGGIVAGDDPEALALRPSHVLRAFVAISLARPLHHEPGVRLGARWTDYRPGSG